MPDTFATSPDVSTIISMLPIEITETKPGLIPSTFIVPAPKDPMKDVEVLVVGRGKFPIYIDENRPSLIVPEPSDRVCAAIVRDYKIAVSGYDPGKAEPGLFFVPGKMLTKEMAKISYAAEIESTRAIQVEWFKNLVSLADDDWSKYHARRMVSSLQKIACKILGLNREWNIDIEIEKQLDLDMTPCKFCRNPVHREAIICGSCQGILDVERYNKEFVSARTFTSSENKPSPKP